MTAPRRPLTEPGTRTTPPVGFQTPTASRPITVSPPPMPQELPTRPAPPVADPSRAAETDLRELDRRIKELEADDEQDGNFAGDPVAQSATPLSDVKMERLKDELGGEMIDGTIRVFFEVGQKRAHLHVPFSPPLAGLITLGDSSTEWTPLYAVAGLLPSTARVQSKLVSRRGM